MQKTPRQNVRRPATRRQPRRGISTIWMIVTLPVVMTMFVVVLDIGHIWLARSELKNALDAAALSGVQTWGEGGTTAQARGDANDAISANTVLGTTLALDTNQGVCTNNNLASTGEIVLGTITDNLGLCTFDCNQIPCPTASVDFTIVTTDNFSDSSAFRIDNFTGPAGSTIDSLRLDLSTIRVDTLFIGDNDIVDGGQFDFRTAVAGDANRGLANTVVTGFSSGGAMIATNDAGGGLQTTLNLTFSSFNPGDELRFGADTDDVGPNTTAASITDRGGEFGDNYSENNPAGDPPGGTIRTVTGLTVSMVVNGITQTVELDEDNNNQSSGTLIFNLTNQTGFGIRTRKTIQVNSVCSQFLNLGLGPYDVTAESFARYACPTNNGPPRLARVDVFSCVCP